MPPPSNATTTASIGSVTTKFLSEYVNNTPKRLKIVDCYLAYILVTGVMQFIYCCLVGTFPFNAFLSGFISCVGSFILAVCLRLQVLLRRSMHAPHANYASYNTMFDLS